MPAVMPVASRSMDAEHRGMDNLLLARANRVQANLQLGLRTRIWTYLDL